MDDPFSAAMALRDLGLSATSSTGTIGLLAEGGTGQAINNVEFSNVQFSGFHYGIRAAALSTAATGSSTTLNGPLLVCRTGNQCGGA